MLQTRRWLIVALIGFIAVLLALAVVALVLFDKKHFGWMVGSAFLEIITSGVIVGALVMLAGAIGVMRARGRQGLPLLIWATIAATSPLFGLMFLLPFGLLAIAAPYVIFVFRGLRRATA